MPPYCLASFSTTSSTLASWFSKRNGSESADRNMSWPDCDWASAAILAGIWRCAMVSTRTVQFACLPNASACLRSSSSAAGTKWFQERKVSSRFCAWAGARPRASHEAIPAVVPAAVRRKRRRWGLRGAVVSMRRASGIGMEVSGHQRTLPVWVSPPLVRRGCVGEGDQRIGRRELGDGLVDHLLGLGVEEVHALRYEGEA